MHRGYVKIWRKSMDHPFYNEPRPMTRREAWETILLTVNHRPGRALIGNTMVDVFPGESVRSVDSWARMFRWTRAKTRRFFTLLSECSQIEIKTNNKTTHLSVCNWGTYQGEAANEQDREQYSEKPVTGQEPATIKEWKNGRSKRTPLYLAPQEAKAGKFSKPTIEEVREYCGARGSKIDPEAFVDYYEAKGWRIGSQPMKDWKAAVRTWERREKSGGAGGGRGRAWDAPDYSRLDEIFGTAKEAAK